MPTRAQDLIEGFISTGVYSVPELFGFEPPPEVKQFRIDNPIAGFAAGAIGTSIPYIGWYKATKYAKAFDDLIEGVGAVKAGQSAFLRKGLAEGIRFAPFEISRAGMAVTTGSSSWGEAIGQVAINEALSFGAGGLVGKLAEIGKRTSARELSEAAGIKLSTPPALQLRQIENHLPSVPPEMVPLYQQRAQDLAHNVRVEEPALLMPHIATKLEGGKNGKDLEPFFAPTKRRKTNAQGWTVYKLFSDPKKYFKRDEDWQSLLLANGIEANRLEHFVRYPRVVTFGSDQAAKGGMSRITRNMNDLGDGWHAVREVNEGMWTIAKHVPGKNNTLDNLHGKMFVAQTDNLDWFFKRPAQIDTAMVDFNKWVRRDYEALGPGGRLVDGLAGRMGRVSHDLLDTIAKVDKSGRVHLAFDKMSHVSGLATKKLGLYAPTASFTQNEAIRTIMDQMHRSMLPFQHQFGKELWPKFLAATYRDTIEEGRMAANELLYGAFEAKGGTTLVNQLWKAEAGAQRVGTGPSTMVKESTEETRKGVWEAWKGNKKQADIVPMLASGRITPDGQKLFNAILDVSAKTNRELKLQNTKLGSSNIYPLNDLIVTKHWKGDIVRPYNLNGKTVAVITGDSVREIERKSKALFDQYPGIKPGKDFTMATRPPNIRHQMNQTSKGKDNLDGYEFYDRPFNKSELLDMLEAPTQQIWNKMSANAADNLLADPILKIRRDFPEYYNAFIDRTNDLKGIERGWETQINKTFDAILGSALGGQSATKISHAVNKTLAHLTLGWLNVATQVATVMTPFNSTVPELMYALGGRMNTDNAVYFTAMGRNGPVGTLGIWDVMKAQGSAMRAILKPTESDLRLMNQGVKEGVFAPQLIAEMVGDRAVGWAGIRQAWIDKDFVRTIDQMGHFFTTKTEQLSRLVSFQIAAEGARIAGFTDEAHIFELAKRITHNSQFRYTQADRAAFMTTPIGGTIGLFKHWPLSFMGNTLKYMGEGINYGNWKPLLYQQSATWAIGGLAASPFANASAEIFNDFVSDDEMVANLYSMFDEESANSIYFGLPAYLGVSVTSASQVPGANGIQDIVSMFTPVMLDRMKYMGMTVGDLYSQWQATRSINPAENPAAMQHLAKAFAPRTLQRIFQSFMDDTLNSYSNGYPILKNPTMADKVLHSAGLPPIQLAKMYEAANDMYKKTELRKSLTSAHGEAYAQAMDVGNSREMWDIVQSAIRQQLDIGSVMKSAAGRAKRGNQDMIERGTSPLIKAKIMQTWGM